MRLLRQPFFLLLLFIAVLSAAMHARIFRTDIIGPHAWRQTQTAANIQYFVREDFNITHPRVHYLINGTNRMPMEFPLLQWSIAAVLKISGEHIFVERLLLFLCGIFALWGMGVLAREIFGRVEAAPLAAWALCFSPLFYYYTMNPLPDLLALCCCIWGAAYFFKWRNERKALFVCLAVFFLALASLCKLPFIVYYALFGGWLWIEGREKTLTLKKFLLVALVVLISLAGPAAWYLTVMPEWSPNAVTSGMLHNSLSGGQLFDILSGTLISTLPELLLNFAAVPFFLLAFYFLFRERKRRRHLLPLLLALLGVLAYYLFEMNTITLVHDYYLMPFLPLLFVTVCYGALKLIDSGGWKKILAFVFLLIMPVTAFLRSDSRWDERDPGFNPDLLKYKTELRKAVPVGAKVIVGNDPSGHIGLYYVDREGWNFNLDQLSVEQLKSLMAKGARYLVSDSRKVEGDAQLMPFFGETKVIGSYHVILLKQP